MISLGGTIGTGLFLASGASVANAGPGGALIAYALIGIMVFFMMECLGEMVRKNETNLRSKMREAKISFKLLFLGHISSHFRQFQ